MYTSSARPGQQPFETRKMRVMNRCGSTALAVGDVVALDLDASDTATQNLQGVRSVTLSEIAEAVFANVVQLGAAPLNAIPVVVTDLLSGDGADDTEVEVAISGIVDAKIGGTNWSSAYASNGVALMADTTGGNRRLVAATDGANTGKVALILDNVATDLALTSAVHKVLLFGWGSSVGSVGA